MASVPRASSNMREVFFDAGYGLDVEDKKAFAQRKGRVLYVNDRRWESHCDRDSRGTVSSDKS